MARNISVNFGGDTGSVQDGRVGLTVATRAFGSLRLECEKDPPQPDEAMSQVARNLVMTTLKDEMIPRASSDLRLLVGDHEPLRQALEARLNEAAAGQGIKVIVVDLELTISEDDRKAILQKYAGIAAAPTPTATTAPVAPVTPNAPPAPTPTPTPIAVAPTPPPPQPPQPPVSVAPPSPPPARPSVGGWSTDIQPGYEQPPPGYQPLNIWSGPSMMRPQQPAAFSQPVAPAPTPPSPTPAAATIGPTTTTAGGEKICGGCGAKLAATALFCTGCGNKL